MLLRGRRATEESSGAQQGGQFDSKTLGCFFTLRAPLENRRPNYVVISEYFED